MVLHSIVVIKTELPLKIRESEMLDINKSIGKFIVILNLWIYD